MPLAPETPKPAAPPVPLRSIPLCPGTLALFLKTPDPSTPRRFYRIEAVGQVERKQNASEVRIQAVWDAATIIANPLCDLPKCKRGAWVYFRVN